MGFAERVKNVRIELKLSQEDLTHKLGVGFATINGKTTRIASICFLA